MKHAVAFSFYLMLSLIALSIAFVLYATVVNIGTTREVVSTTARLALERAVNRPAPQQPTPASSAALEIERIKSAANGTLDSATQSYLFTIMNLCVVTTAVFLLRESRRLLDKATGVIGESQKSQWATSISGLLLTAHNQLVAIHDLPAVTPTRLPTVRQTLMQLEALLNRCVIGKIRLTEEYLDPMVDTADDVFVLSDLIAQREGNESDLVGRAAEIQRLIGELRET